jgi:hypothetical protein
LARKKTLAHLRPPAVYVTKLRKFSAAVFDEIGSQKDARPSLASGGFRDKTQKTEISLRGDGFYEETGLQK